MAKQNLRAPTVKKIVILSGPWNVKKITKTNHKEQQNKTRKVILDMNKAKLRLIGVFSGRSVYVTEEIIEVIPRKIFGFTTLNNRAN